MLDFFKLQKKLSAVAGEKLPKKIRDFSFLIGEGAVDLTVNLILMIMVERALGLSGLGVFSYLLSILIFAGFVSDFGVASYLEREISVSSVSTDPRWTIEKACRAVMVTSALCAILLFVNTFSGTTLTRVDEKAVGYFIIGITILLRNANRMRMAMLCGLGKFDKAARLNTEKRIILLGSTLFLLMCRLPASVIIAGFLLAEMGLFFRSRKQARLPALKVILRGRDSVQTTLSESFHYLFTDETLDVVLHLDFFLLGVFVSSADLGLYAEASILARSFLIIPISIRPVFRKSFCSLISTGQIRAAARSVHRSAAFLFSFHSVLAVYILLYYPAVIDAIYHSQRKSFEAFHIFAMFLPGLLFFSALTSLEPLYEAEGKVAFLQQHIIQISFLNLILNLFFIPFAGYYGAAFATAVSMFGYFLFFGRQLTPVLKLPKLKFLSAGTSVYLTYMFFNALDLNLAFSILLVPIFIITLFFLLNIFSFELVSDDTSIDTLVSCNTHTKEV